MFENTLGFKSNYGWLDVLRNIAGSNALSTGGDGEFYFDETGDMFLFKAQICFQWQICDDDKRFNTMPLAAELERSARGVRVAVPGLASG